MRLIDADALLNGFDVNWVTEYDEAGFSMEYKAVPVGAIENAPTIDAMPKWISVEERLPEKSGLYLAFTMAGNTMTLDYSAKYRAFNAFDSHRRSEVFQIYVTHWMPLPEPPKEDT